MTEYPPRTAETVRRSITDGVDPIPGEEPAALLALGSPLITDAPDDPQLVRALFVWHGVSGDPPGAVYLWVNRLTDKGHIDRGMMRPRGGGLWFVELTVPRDVLATYRFLPLSAGQRGQQQVPPPRELLRFAEVDPENATAAAGSPFGSVLAGPAAPGIEAWTSPAAVTSTVVDRTVDVGPVSVRHRLAVPRGPAPADLLVVFDADSWFDRFRLPDVLAAAGRRCAVLGIDSPADPAARLRFLSAHDGLFEAMEAQAVPDARCRIGSGRVVVAGQSLGGLAALAFAARNPDLVDEVLAYSPSVWWRPGIIGRPADVTARQAWVHDLVRRCPPGAFSIRLASGAFEEELTPGVRDLAATAEAAGHLVEHTVYTGGHDEVQWAAHLLAHLAAAPQH
ncbi:hypothetical protein AXK56_01675 [Tsukamurella pulmonis]|uniref:Enterochelin esterase n=1 Tax=Tsukamurella pulmonis TaxID=47312 RepID=A0A1H1EQ74_9ACTN|nr:alpha/beta hydrolase-fold protein [Tsukamurella pulmonis]KXO91859.1 hypothetical protein AXK56_01675 [Tsukamurella pulmonis]SDQ90718.1 Enterochelin esterase [Tsukamurella pulmonis]SUP20635.1 enterobactin/ferric enterobactin esterase [Tsukamurella pulmonis]